MLFKNIYLFKGSLNRSHVNEQIGFNHLNRSHVNEQIGFNNYLFKNYLQPVN